MLNAILTATILILNCSAYTTAADECGWDTGITYYGYQAQPHYTVASDDLPRGTLLIRVGDHQVYEVQDKFGGEYSNRLDICMSTKSEAFRYGRRYEMFYVIYPRDHTLRLRPLHAMYKYTSYHICELGEFFSRKRN